MGSPNRDPSKDFGHPTLVVSEFGNAEHRNLHRGLTAEWRITDGDGARRSQVDLIATRDAGSVDEIWIVTTDAEGTEQTALHLGGEDAERFVALIRNNAFEGTRQPAPGASSNVIPIPMAIAAAYERNPEVLRAIVSADASARDIVALAHRRAVVADFRRLLEDPDYFKARRDTQAKVSAEAVWQELFEANPWLLGLGLSAQLLVGWDPNRLEQVVAGFDVTGPGKRTDAFMKTAGVIQLLAFVEIKRHDTELLETKTYRSGAYAPSHELSGAVAQVQTTVQLAEERIRPVLHAQDDDGYDIPGGDSYLYRPRSYVVAGHRGEFISEMGGHNRDKIRSFELYRRNLESPEIITYDELLERAEALVALADNGGSEGPSPSSDS